MTEETIELIGGPADGQKERVFAYTEKIYCPMFCCFQVPGEMQLLRAVYERTEAGFVFTKTITSEEQFE